MGWLLFGRWVGCELLQLAFCPPDPGEVLEGPELGVGQRQSLWPRLPVPKLFWAQ